MTIKKFLLCLAATWFVFGLLFWQLDSWDADFKQDSKAIAGGFATEHVYRVVEKPVSTDRSLRTDQDQTNDTVYMIILDGPGRISRDLPLGEWEQIKISQEFTGFHVNGRVRLPEIDTGNFDLGKSALLQLSILISLVLTGNLGWQLFRGRQSPSAV